MVVFHPPYNSLRRLGQEAVVVPAPVSAPVVVTAPAPDIIQTNYDKPLVTLSPAGIVIGGLVLIGLAFSLSHSLASRR